jgi:hypothetical protein
VLFLLSYGLVSISFRIYRLFYRCGYFWSLSRSTLKNHCKLSERGKGVQYNKRRVLRLLIEYFGLSTSIIIPIWLDAVFGYQCCTKSSIRTNLSIHVIYIAKFHVNIANPIIPPLFVLEQSILSSTFTF